MHEKDLMRRELAKQTALLFVVFAVLFALLGLGIYSMVSANVFRDVYKRQSRFPAFSEGTDAHRASVM